MNKDENLQYVRKLQELRAGFLDQVTPNDMNELMIEHCIENFENGINRALEAVCEVYCEIIGKEVRDGK